MSDDALDLPRDQRCPYCDGELEEWEPNAYQCWENTMMFCPNDRCDYFRHGRRDIAERYNKNFGYRYCYDPVHRKAFALISWCGGSRSYLKRRCSA